MENTNIEKNHYIALRRAIGISVMSFYPLCLLIGFVFGNGRNHTYWWQTISGQYHANTKVIFIGALFSIAMFLILYHGYDWKDRLVNTLTSIFLLGALIFPSGGVAEKLGSCDGMFDIPVNVSHALHCTCGIGIFVMFVINIRFLFTKNNGEMTDKKKQRNLVYKICAYTVCVAELLGALAIFTPNEIQLKLTWLSCVITNISFIAIGIAWLVKGESIKRLNDE